MAEHLVEKEKAKAKAEAAAKIKSAADKRALHSFYFLHSLFTLNDAKNPINSYHVLSMQIIFIRFIRPGIQEHGQSSA